MANFALPAELIIWKGVKERNSNTYSGGQYAQSTIHYNIETETGEYIVPKSFFEDSIGSATYINTHLIHTEKGLTNPELRPQSYIQYQFEKEAIVEIEEYQ